MTRPTWDQSFIDMAKGFAQRSKDPSTKVGAVIVGPDNEVRSLGYNCFPRGVNDNIPSRFDRPEKYKWFEHAERNAIYNAARVGIPLKGCHIYVSWIPCSDCARAIIQSGITALIVEDLSIPERWRADFLVSIPMLREAGIVIRRPDVVKGIEPFDILWRERFVTRADGATGKICGIAKGITKPLKITIWEWLTLTPRRKKRNVLDEHDSFETTINDLEASLVVASE